MKKNELSQAFEEMKPTEAQKERMLKHVLYRGETGSRKAWRKTWTALAAACAALACAAMVIFSPFGGKTRVAYALSVSTPDGSLVQLSDPSAGARSPAVAFVDNGPELRFFIAGEDIAEVTVSSAEESVSATDFTQTLDEQYWNPELYYQETVIDGVTYQYVPAESLFRPSITVAYPEGFTDYEEVWYSWYGWGLRHWAMEDEDARIQKFNGLTDEEVQALWETVSEEERLAIASGGGSTSAAGHFLLEGCPEELLEDTVTIAITDRQGKTTVQTIRIAISSNSLGQTVVTASLEK